MNSWHVKNELVRTFQEPSGESPFSFPNPRKTHRRLLCWLRWHRKPHRSVGTGLRMGREGLVVLHLTHSMWSSLCTAPSGLTCAHLNSVISTPLHKRQRTAHCSLAFSLSNGAWQSSHVRAQAVLYPLLLLHNILRHGYCSYKCLFGYTSFWTDTNFPNYSLSCGWWRKWVEISHFHLP